MSVDSDLRIDPEHRANLRFRGVDRLAACLTFAGDETVKDLVPGRQTVRFESRSRSYHLKRILGEAWRELGRECRILDRLEAAGLPVAHPVAFGERFGAAAMITQTLPSRGTLEDLLVRGRPEPDRVRRLVLAAAQLLRRIHAEGVNHRDFYLTHLLVDDEDRLFVVDFGRAEQRRRVPWRRRVKDLAAFDFSTPERVCDASLRREFLVAYLGDDGQAHCERLDRAVRRKSRILRRHVLRKLRRGDANVHVNE